MDTEEVNPMDVAFDNLDESIVLMSRMIKNAAPGFGARPDREMDDNIARLEKLIVMRAAMAQLYRPEVSNSPENSEAGTVCPECSGVGGQHQEMCSEALPF